MTPALDHLYFSQLFDHESSTFTYLLMDQKSRDAVLIDPVLEHFDRDSKLLDELQAQLVFSIETHVHADHITSAAKLRQKWGSKVAISAAAKADCADLLLRHGEVLSFGDFQLQALATPGHTPTCLSFYLPGRVFTGDALLIRGCGRTDFQHGSATELYHSVHQRLFCLPPETLVFPGHDYKGFSNSTIELEKKFNPRLGGGRTLAEFETIMSSLKLDPPRRIDQAVPANLRCGTSA